MSRGLGDVYKRQFIKYAKDELPEEYRLLCMDLEPKYDSLIVRVVNSTSVSMDKERLDKFHGCPYVVGIDIFPVDNITDDKDALKKQVESLKFLLSTVESVPEEAPYSVKVLELMKKIEKTFGIPINYDNRLRHELKKIYDIVCARYQHENSEEVCSMIDYAEGWDYHAKRAWYEDVCEMPFENTTIPVPAGYDGLLRIKYGDDYMTCLLYTSPSPRDTR